MNFEQFLEDLTPGAKLATFQQLVQSISKTLATPVLFATLLKA